jgi:hypothetical protein
VVKRLPVRGVVLLLIRHPVASLPSQVRFSKIAGMLASTALLRRRRVLRLTQS